MLLLVWAWTEWVCIVAGKCLVDPPQSPALRRSWGKVLVCHKGLGGVFCVSGPDVCQPKGLVYQLENLWVQLASQSFLVGQPQLYCCAKSLFSPPFFVVSSPSFPQVDPSSASCFPNPFTFLHLAPLSPLFGLCPFTPVTRPSLMFFCPFTPFRLSS